MKDDKRIPLAIDWLTAQMPDVPLEKSQASPELQAEVLTKAPGAMLASALLSFRAGDPGQGKILAEMAGLAIHALVEHAMEQAGKELGDLRSAGDSALATALAESVTLAESLLESSVGDGSCEGT